MADERALDPTDAEPTTPAAAPDTVAEVDPDVAQLLGLRPVDAGPLPSADELDTLGEITDTRIYQGDLEARPPDGDQPDEGQAANLESLLDSELRDGETDDPNEAAEEGLTWIPPTDPPVRAGEDGEPEVAAGFGTSARDEPFDADHHGALLSPHDEVELRVLEALRADASTSGLVDRLTIDVEGSRVTISGEVEDLLDEEALLAVAEAVPGVATAASRLRITSLAGTEPARVNTESGGTTA